MQVLCRDIYLITAFWYISKVMSIWCYLKGSISYSNLDYSNTFFACHSLLV